MQGFLLMAKKKIMVSGCFDMLHSGHVEFFRQAAKYGDLYVAIGSDKTIYELKKRAAVNNQDERLFMVQSVRWVEEAFISRGSGKLDFIEELKEIKPDYFLVNGEGHSSEKEELCKSLGIDYLILKREPYQNLIPRSTSELRLVDRLPYRIDLAGGWLDQPFVSQYHPGPVVTISLEPTLEFNRRSGMATSTRENAREIWGTKMPQGDYEKLAKLLFSYDNPPGTQTISGSQDSIGLVFPGIAKAHYDGKYWPEYIEHNIKEELLHFVENNLYLIPLSPREEEYDVLADTQINMINAKSLAEAADDLWIAIQNLDIKSFGTSMRKAFEAQILMFPNMMNDSVKTLINKYQECSLGWKLSGAGGGGYLILVSEDPIDNAIQVSARRAL
jgi:cytidyltransferase-like protein